LAALSAARVVSVRKIVLESMAPVPADKIGVMSLLARGRDAVCATLDGIDHDFVIVTFGCNKLKD